MAGSVQAPAGNAAAPAAGSPTARSPLGKRLRDDRAGRRHLVGAGRVRRRARRAPRGGGRIRRAARAAARSTSRPRRTAAASPTRGPLRRTPTTRTPSRSSLLVVSGDDAAADPNVRVLAEHADKVIVFAMYKRGLATWADVVIPATSYLERDGTVLNLEGRLQRQRRTVIPPATDETAVVAELGRRLGVAIPGSPIELFEQLSERLYGGLVFDDVSETAELPPPAARAGGARSPTGRGDRDRRDRGRPARSSATGRCSRARSSSASPSCSSSAPSREIALAPRDATARGIATGDPVLVQHERHVGRAARAHRARARARARAPRGGALPRPGPLRRGDPAIAPFDEEPHERALVDRRHQGARHRQPRDGRVRLHDVAGAQAARPHAAPLRARTVPASSACCSRSPT